MPELPEVTTIVGQLKDSLVGKTISGVEVRLPKIFVGSSDRVIGSRIIDVKRRAKMIIIELNNGFSLVVHLKMTGQLIYGEARGKNQESRETVSFPNPIPYAGTTLPGKTTHVIFTFKDGSKLFFNDMRQFGWIKVVKSEELKEKIDEKLGPDALGEGFTEEYLAKICKNWGRAIKLLLLEQSKIAGIGNIYANEALWYAEISPTKKGKDIEPKIVPRLRTSIIEVLKLGIKYHGSSAGDEAYVDAYGVGGKMQDHTIVYQRAGQKCPRCGGKIVRIAIGGRGTFYCPKCQKN